MTIKNRFFALSLSLSFAVVAAACGQEPAGSELDNQWWGAGAPAGEASNDLNAFVPATGFPAGNPAQTEDRVGPTGVRVPGRCPPTQEAINRQVALKNPQFPRGADLESRIQRFEKTLSAIQDLQCPAASTTLLGRLKSLTALRGDPNATSILQGLGINETPADRR